MDAGGDHPIDRGWAALEQARWTEARTCFEGVLTHADDARAHEGLGLALWFLGEVPAAIAARERAFELHARAGSCSDAARCAVWVSHQYFIGERQSAARGWLARADRVLDGVPECAGHGWVAVELARHAPGVDDRRVRASEAVEIARRTHDVDLEVFALSLLGRAETSAGHQERGLLLMEEAMAAATAGRVRNAHTLGEAYCNLIMACADAGHWERATEWCEVVDEFARSHGAAPLFGACRGVHADVLLATGHWPEAEEALATALTTHARNIPALGAPAEAALAELRVRQGRLADAERLLAGREERPAALRALALLRIAQNRPAEAAVLLVRGLQGCVGDAVRTSQLLATLVDARLASGELGPAALAVDELAVVASGSSLRLVVARSELAAARVAHATGRADEAAEPARRALAAFLSLSMPLDAGEARLELARALAATAPEVAADEAQTARAVFRDLGAARAVDAASGLLRDLGERGGGVRHGGGTLTAREQQVLELVARGLSNARIAQTLVISEKTAGHHVSNILTKLGVRNRTEAAAHLADVTGQPRIPSS